MEKRYYNIDMLRILFSVIIVYFHILHSNIMGYVGDNGIYKILQSKSDDAMYIVEMFFVIAGFFFYYSYHRKETDCLGFIIGKMVRLWPVLALSTLLGGLLGKFSCTDIFNLLFLQCMGISLEYKGINWYISSYFWAIVFLYGLLKNVKPQNRNFILAILVYLSYVININYCNGGFGRETVYVVFSLGLLRGIAGIGLGYLIADMYEYIRKTKWKDFFAIKNEKVEFVVFSILEILSFGFLLIFTLLNKLEYQNKFIFVIFFVILFVCFILKKGVLSKLSNQKIFGMLGKYTFSIYAIQQVSFTVMQNTIWKSTALIEHAGLCLLISVGVSLLFGVAAYYLVENPCAKIYRSKRRKIGNMNL